MLSQDQRKVITDFFNNDSRLLVIKGSAGTGKTHTIQEIYNEYKNIFVVAPSNKAAAVLRRKKLEPGDKPLHATTIHRAFYKLLPTGKTKVVLHKVLDPQTHKPKRTDTGEPILVEAIEPILEYQFDRNAPGAMAFLKIPACNAICIIDESSMVGAVAWADLFTFPGKLIIVGDEKQLPPVDIEADNMRKAGNLPQNIAKYIGYFMHVKPDVRLTVQHRQDNDSTIHQVIETVLRSGGCPFPFVSDNAICVEVGSEGLDDQRFNEIITDKEGDYEIDAVITWTNVGRDYLNGLIRAYKFRKDFATEPKWRNIIPRVGDKLYVDAGYRDGQVIVTKGDTLTVVGIDESFLRRDVLNGIVILNLQRDEEEGEILENIDVRLQGFSKDLPVHPPKIPSLSVSYGYAITAHKAQGSQYKTVVVIDDLYAGGPVDKPKWIYTAITRAKKQLYVFRLPGFKRLIESSK
jgi:ATP-dependent exoDNAse (exonuclease V) alpha subunit